MTDGFIHLSVARVGEPDFVYLFCFSFDIFAASVKAKKLPVARVGEADFQLAVSRLGGAQVKVLLACDMDDKAYFINA